MGDLERELDTLESKGELLLGGGLTDRNIRPAILLLGRAVLRLDRTSGHLARVNIGLTIVITAVGILQLIVMCEPWIKELISKLR
jgi:hypothetical protein